MSEAEPEEDAERFVDHLAKGKEQLGAITYVIGMGLGRIGGVQ